MPERPYDDIWDMSIPYFDRTPATRASRASMVKFVNAFGTHLICPRRACRREGGCADRDPRAIPFCWTLYRGVLRFFLLVAAKRLGAGTGARRPEDNEPFMPEPFRGRPLLAQWEADGIDIQSLARTAEDGPDDWDYESIPELRELFDELTEGQDAPAARYLGLRGSEKGNQE